MLPTEMTSRVFHAWLFPILSLAVGLMWLGCFSHGKTLLGLVDEETIELCPERKFAGNSTMEIPTKTGGDDPSPSGWSWRWWLLILLFPIPFSPWWLTIICLAVFCSLVYLFTREES
jgi:hypothetical protein